MRFVVDAQLPPALAKFLAQAGQLAEHVADLQLAHASDSVIWDYARAANAVVITKDEDFAARRAVAQAGPQILWVRIGNTTTPQLLQRLAGRFEEVVRMLQSGEKVVELV